MPFQGQPQFHEFYPFALSVVFVYFCPSVCLLLSVCPQPICPSFRHWSVGLSLCSLTAKEVLNAFASQVAFIRLGLLTSSPFGASFAKLRSVLTCRLGGNVLDAVCCLAAQCPEFFPAILSHSTHR
jgi:hypothetical protein